MSRHRANHTPEDIAEAILAGAERMQVDLRSTLDLPDTIFRALTELAEGSAR